VSEFADRLEKARKALGWTGDRAASYAEASRSTVYNWESGNGRPSESYLRAMLGAGIDPAWLLTGEGEMRRPDTEVATVALAEIAAIIDRVRSASAVAEDDGEEDAILATPEDGGGEGTGTEGE
jgi:transcriptional regulator with XRE-family HTH domain